MIHLYVAAGLLLVAAIAGFIGRKQGAKADTYDLYVEANSPKELADGVPAFYGGTVAVVDGQPKLTAPYSKQACVWYEFTLEQEIRRRNANGTETTNWETISSQPAQGVIFNLEGANGSVQIDPTKADVAKPEVYQSIVQPADAQGREGVAAVVGNVANVLSSLGGNQQRVTERYVPVGQRLYAGGVATDQQGQKVFANDQSYPLVLTTQSKADLVKSDRRYGVVGYGVAGVLVVAAVVVATVLKK